jgi:hypothetical protein
MSNSVRRYLGYGYGLVQGHVLSGPPVLSCDSVIEAKCTRLGYRTRLSRLYTLYPLLALAFLRSSHSATPNPEQENNQRTPDKSQVPQVDPPTTGLHNSNQRQDRKKVTDHMRDKYAKRDIKLEHNSMNIIAHRVRKNELVTPPEPAPRVG